MESRSTTGPSCRGIRLDSGELDEIIEREGEPVAVRRGADDEDEDDGRCRGKRRGGLADLLDFGG